MADEEPQDPTDGISDSPVPYTKQEYIQTASGNRVSRRAVLCGTQNIQLSGRSLIQPKVMLRGDLAVLRIGKFVIVGDGCVLRPPYKRYKGSVIYLPMAIGDYVTFGCNTVVSATCIGSCVRVGENCVISKRCILRDNSMLLPNSCLPPDSVVPPFTIFGGNPATYQGDLPEAFLDLQKEATARLYK